MIHTKQEEFVSISGLQNIFASKKGKIREQKNGKLRPFPMTFYNGRPYLNIKFKHKGWPAICRIPLAKLIAYTFIGEPESKDRKLSYKDGDPTNCAAHNLEWLTPRQYKLKHRKGRPTKDKIKEYEEIIRYLPNSNDLSHGVSALEISFHLKKHPTTVKAMLDELVEQERAVKISYSELPYREKKKHKERRQTGRPSQLYYKSEEESESETEDEDNDGYGTIKLPVEEEGEW